MKVDFSLFCFILFKSMNCEKICTYEWFDLTVHPSCVDLTEELARRAARSPWQCPVCKTCFVCDDSGYAVSLFRFIVLSLMHCLMVMALLMA